MPIDAPTEPTASATAAQAKLRQMLRPAGGGVYVVSTGVAQQQALMQAVYGVSDPAQIEPAWHAALSNLATARVAVLGVPSDTGAGFTRGANRAPAALRGHLLGREHAFWRDDVTDVGDVRVVPQLLDDAMLSRQQIEAVREALYGQDGAALPVSPLDICRSAIDALYALNPTIRPVVIGGDHSVGWPAFAASWAHWERDRGRRIGLLHFDAHTDLLRTRLGVRYCFATWAWHANALLGQDGRLVQVGIRTSGRTREHWESTLGVRQYWSAEVQARPLDEIVDEIISRYEGLGVDALYVSNDIDGTDPAFAAATGTPEPGGLTPTQVRTITQRLAARFELIGGDVVEVAPPLSHELPGEPERTLSTAAGYLADLIAP
ncbi:MAG: agmatinase [Bradymonadia bacterium]|jgi:agmatinase